MIDVGKIDDEDMVFINKSLSEKEEKAFSDFLTNRKKKTLRIKTNEKRKAFPAQ